MNETIHDMIHILAGMIRTIEKAIKELEELASKEVFEKKEEEDVK